VTPAEAAQVLESSCAAYAALLRSLPPAVAAWRPSRDEWCVKECVGHLIVAEERAFAGRIRLILDADDPHFEPWDAAEVERERHDAERSTEDLLGELEPMRRSGLEMLRSLRPEQLQRSGMHPHVSRLTVNDLVHEWVHHDANHLRQAYAVVQAYVWPDMGNAQRFSSG
jgi:hypothetical protein